MRKKKSKELIRIECLRLDENGNLPSDGGLNGPE